MRGRIRAEGSAALPDEGAPAHAVWRQPSAIGFAFGRSVLGLAVFALALGATASPPRESAAAQPDHRLGLPPLTLAPGTPAATEKISLGRTLFHDKRLSADGTVSCASCHKPELAHSDGLAQSVGVGGRRGTRNAPSILNAAFLNSLFWDGRRTSLEEQANDPFTESNEHGFKDEGALLQQVRGIPEYRTGFQQAFGVQGDAIRMEHVTGAIAAFERTLIAGNSAFDHYQYAGDRAALSPSAERGLRLFTGRAACSTCHTVGEQHALFTDQQFHSLGVGMHRIQPRLGIVAAAVVETKPRASTEAVSPEEIAELGRFLVTKAAGDIGKFRTPSLRNVALTAPYMHDGSVATLEEAVELEIYYRGVAAGRPLILTPEEKKDLVTFLRALTSAGLGPSR